MEPYDINSIHGISMREVASVCGQERIRLGILQERHTSIDENSYHIYQLPYETPNIIYTKLLYDNDSLLAYTNMVRYFTTTRCMTVLTW